MSINKVLLLALSVGLSAATHSFVATASCERTTSTACSSSTNVRSCTDGVMTVGGTCFKQSNGIEYNVSTTVSGNGVFGSGETVLLDENGQQTGDCKVKVVHPVRSGRATCRAKFANAVTQIRVRLRT